MKKKNIVVIVIICVVLVGAVIAFAASRRPTGVPPTVTVGGTVHTTNEPAP